MSDERSNGISDPVVSETYRDAATERAPASLNEAVLRNAAAHAKKGYAHSMLWMRPLAWAATVVLSLAIVVQLVLPPGADPELPATSPMVLSDIDAGDADMAGARTADEDDPLKRLRDQEVREDSKIEEFEVPAVAATPEPAAEVLQEGPGAAADQARDEPAAQAFALRPESLESAARNSAASIQASNDMARQRSAQPADYGAAPAIEVTACEPEEIETPEAWAECIERLEEVGRLEEALAERGLLRAAFPDFEWPAE